MKQVIAVLVTLVFGSLVYPSSGFAQSDVITLQAGHVLRFEIANFAAPQTVSLSLANQTLESQRILSHEAELAVTIPRDTPPGETALTVRGEQGEELMIPLRITADSPSADTPAQGSRAETIGLIALLIALVAGGVWVGRRFHARLALLLLVGGCLVVGPQLFAQESETATPYPYAGRAPDFIMLVPSDLQRPDTTETGLYRMNDFADPKERQGYFGRIETILFVQRLAAHWERVQAEHNAKRGVQDEPWQYLVTVNDLSLFSGAPFPPHATHQTGRSIDLWLEHRPLAGGNRLLAPARSLGADWQAADSYSPQLAQAFLEAIAAAAKDVKMMTHLSTFLPKVLFIPKDHIPLAVGNLRTEEVANHANHWHIELPNPAGGYYTN